MTERAAIWMEISEPVEGGGTPYLQQQNFSLSALAKRDAQQDPFASGSGASRSSPKDPPSNDQEYNARGAAHRLRAHAALPDLTRHVQNA